MVFWKHIAMDFRLSTILCLFWICFVVSCFIHWFKYCRGNSCFQFFIFLNIFPKISTESYEEISVVIFQRTTVIFTEIILLIGAYLISQEMQTSKYSKLVFFIFFAFNPGLILVDNIHFQYNGMLLGILILSVFFAIKVCCHILFFIIYWYCLCYS